MTPRNPQAKEMNDESTYYQPLDIWDGTTLDMFDCLDMVRYILEQGRARIEITRQGWERDPGRLTRSSRMALLLSESRQKALW
jgi:hypothetical protein